MKRALMVIDMQNDYLWDRRDKRFTYDTEMLCGNINRRITETRSRGDEVIYIRQVLPNVWIYRQTLQPVLRGTEGANLYSGIDLVSNYCFEKLFPSAFSAKAFQEFVSRQGIETVDLCGIDENACIAYTALGAIKRRLTVNIFADSVESIHSEKKIEKTRQRLRNAGVNYLS